MQPILTPALILDAYRQGLFPMAYDAHSPFIHWVCPDIRGQLSIKNLHVSRRLIKTLKNKPYEITINRAFGDVIEGCAAPVRNRPETWINDPIKKVFCALHFAGAAHSVECWDNGILIGGIYGLAIGGAFFGESMFSRATDASKIALVNLTARLWRGGFQLFDTQFINDHLKQFGAFEIPHAVYKKILTEAINIEADFSIDGQSQDEILYDYLGFLRVRTAAAQTNPIKPIQ
jgi:leucyl/phenylalanyl-tRNA--protein transferase